MKANGVDKAIEWLSMPNCYSKVFPEETIAELKKVIFFGK